MYSGIELLGHMVVLSSVFWETSILLFTVAAQIYISTFLHILPNICYLSTFLIVAIWSGVKWYLIVLSVWISLIISGVEHLFMCQLAICISSLEKYLFSSSFYFFKLGCLLFDVELHDNPILIISCANICPPFIRLYFHFLDGFLCFEKAFKFN